MNVLQKFLTKANKEIIEFFLAEIDSSVNKLMMDKYGNYFCQELLHSCSGQQRLNILKKVEDNFLFLEKNYLEVKYIKNLNQLKQINKDKYDYLISIENSLLGLIISAIVKSNIKISFKRVFGSFVFNKIIPLKKTRHNFLNLMDVSNLLKHVFSNSMEIIPKYHHENPIVIKNHEMIHWIFNTNHSIDLVNSDYVLIDIFESI